MKFYNLSTTQILREIKLWWIQMVKKCHFLALLEVLNFNFCKFEPFLKSQIHQNSKLGVSKMAKNDILGPFEFAKIWFHVKSEWQQNYQASTKSSLNFTFWRFLEQSAFKWHAIRMAYIPQCGNFRIFLSLRFYVKSILKNLEVQNQPF